MTQSVWMVRRQEPRVLVVRMWYDDGGVRAVLQANTTAGEAAYNSMAALRDAIDKVLDSWQVDPSDRVPERRVRGDD